MRIEHCILFLLFSISANSQSGLFINGVDASLRVDSNSFISVDGDFYNIKCEQTAYVRFNGSLFISGSLINNDSLRFSGTTGTGNSKKARVIFRSTIFTPTNPIGAIIGGTCSPLFWEVEMDKGTGQRITLANNVRCLDTLTFKSGIIYMNGYKWKIVDPFGAANIINHPFIKNEKNGSQFMALSLSDTGLVQYRTIYTNSTYINPANIGIEINGPLNLLSPLFIQRGFQPQINAAKTGILRYYDLYSSGHSLINNSLKLRYCLNDMSYFSPGYVNLISLLPYASPNTDMNWSQLPSVLQNTLITVTSSTLNGEMTVNLSDLNLPNINIAGEAFRITLADANCISPPVSSLIIDTLHICAGTSNLLDAGNNSSITNSSLKWEWNTTPIAYTRTISVSPNTAYQKYIVKLKDVRGCISIDSIIIAPQAPYPQITYFNHLNACFGDSVIIKDTVKISSGTYSNAWLFSDNGNSSTIQQTFKKLFSSAGTHAFQLTSTSNYGCSVVASATNVIVYPLPLVSFTNSYNCALGLMDFTNTSISNYSTLSISSLNWNLGLGVTNTSTLNNPSQSYTASGTYSVKLRATSSFGCHDSLISSIVVYPKNIASFTKNNTCLYDTVFYTNTSICNTGTCTYNWQFGDATQSYINSPKKVFSNPGLYTTKLKLTPLVGCADSISNIIFVNSNPVSLFTSSSGSACVNEILYFTNTSSISMGSISNYTWNFNNNSSLSSVNSQTNFTLSGLNWVGLIAVSDSGCVGNFSIPITIHPQPVSSFTVNTVCLGNSTQFICNSSGTGLSYSYDFGDNNMSSLLQNNIQTHMYSSAGSYSSQLITYNIWGCSDTTGITVSVLPSPIIGLAGNIQTCGTSYTLDAGNPGSSYFWQPGNQTSQTINATSNGIYSISVTNTSNCSATETVQLILNSIVQPNLGNDTTVCGSIILNAGYPGGIFNWNNSITTQTQLVTNGGLYSVQVTDLNNCVGYDTIHVTILSLPILNLGNNLTVCKPKNGIFITPTTNAQSFLWNTGVLTPSLNVKNTGLYWCKATSANNCSIYDTLSVTFLNTPLVDLGPDKSSCGKLLLDANNFLCTYLWNNTITQQTIEVNNSGVYHVNVTNTLSGCSQNDTILVTILPTISVYLGNDTAVCNNSVFILNANNPQSNYNWTTGATTQSIQITSSGVYGVTVSNSEGCSSSDYVQINLLPAPRVDLGNNVRYLCGENPIELSTAYTGTIRWESQIGIIGTANSISLNQEGKYKITVNNGACSASDSILIIKTTNTIQALFLASSLDTINKPVKFINLSDPAPVSQQWNFGDGTISNELNPIHTFVLPNNYNITLEVSNGFCSDRLTKEINALFRISLDTNAAEKALRCKEIYLYPNPTNDKANLIIEFSDEAKLILQLLDVCGRFIHMQEDEFKSHYSKYIDLANLDNGIYFVKINAISQKGNFYKNIKLIKMN